MDGVFAKSDPIIKPCEKGYSFFHDLIEPEWPSNEPLHRLCSLVRKMGVVTLIREDLEPSEEVLQEIEDVAACADMLGTTISAKVTRLSFIRAEISDWKAVRNDDFLGYAVVVDLLRNGVPLEHGGRKVSFVLESVARPPSLFIPNGKGILFPAEVSNYYTHCVKVFPTIIGTQKDHIALSITGSFFCQQNRLTHRCAHAALRMAINSCPTLNLPKLTNHKINEVLGFDLGKSAQIEALRNGLSKKQIAQVVENLGLQPMSIDLPNNLGIDYAEYIYPLIESKMPVILGLGLQLGKHAVAVLGHTVNSDRWEPEARSGYGSFPYAQYHSSAEWADHFIIADDNFGMYVTLPREMVTNFITPKYNPNIHADTAIGIVPKDVIVTGHDAETIAALVIESLLRTALTLPGKCRWLTYFSGHMKDKEHCHPQPVCRTVLIDRHQYCQELGAHPDSEGNPLSPDIASALEAQLPEKIWVTEVSLPALYGANKTKLGDILIRADADKTAHMQKESVVFAWLPGVAWIGPKLSGYIPDWPFKGHIPFLRHGQAPKLEW